MKNLILRKSVVWGFVFSLTGPVLYGHAEEAAQPVEDVKVDAAKSDPAIADAAKPEAVTPVAVKTEKVTEQNTENKYANAYGKKKSSLR